MTAAADEPKLGKQVKELLRKFSEQEQLVRALQKQLAASQTKSKGLEGDIEALQQQKKKEEDKCDSLDRLAIELRKKKDETLDEVKEREAVEAKARQELTQRFQATIAEITAKMESDAQEQHKAVNENNKLRAQLSTLEQQVGLRAQQYEQLIKTRDVELRITEAKAEHLRELAKGDRFRAVKQQARLEQEREKEAELKEQLSTITQKFDTLQTTIVKSNAMFKEYKGEMDKLTKRIKLLDNERAELRKRYAAKKKPHDTVQEETEAQRKKLEALQKQGASLAGVMDVLRRECADFEGWKEACPEAHARAEAELAEKGEL